MSISFYSLIERAPSDSFISSPNPSVILRYAETIDGLKAADKKETLFMGTFSDNLPDNIYGETHLLLYSHTRIEANPFPGLCNVIILYDIEEYYSLLNFFMHDLNESARINSVSRQFMEIVSSGGSIQKLLNYGCHVLENPLLMVDMSFRYIASAGTDSLLDQPTWKHTIEIGIMPKDYLSMIMSKEVLFLESDEYPNQIITDHPYGDDTHDCYSIKIFNNGKMYGYLKLLCKYSEFSTFHQKVLLLLGQYAGVLRDNLLQIYNFNENSAENLLTSMLLGKIESGKASGVLNTVAPARFRKNLYIINICFKEHTDLDDTLFYTHTRIKRYFAKNIVSIVNGDFAILYDTNEDSNDVMRSTGFLKLLQDIGCYANISLVFHNLDETSAFYEQTNFCNEYRKLTGADNDILDYKDVYEYQMILSLKDRVELSSLIHPIVRKLRQTDVVKDTDYATTLFSYVKNNLSISDTAEELSFHYNTIKHRLEKIIEITGFDESDKESLFQISLSEKILKVVGHAQR